MTMSTCSSQAGGHVRASHGTIEFSPTPSMACIKTEPRVLNVFFNVKAKTHTGKQKKQVLSETRALRIREEGFGRQDFAGKKKGDCLYSELISSDF